MNTPTLAENDNIFKPILEKKKVRIRYGQNHGTIFVLFKIKKAENEFNYKPFVIETIPYMKEINFNFEDENKTSIRMETIRSAYEESSSIDINIPIDMIKSLVYITNNVSIIKKDNHKAYKMKLSKFIQDNPDDDYKTNNVLEIIYDPSEEGINKLLLHMFLAFVNSDKTPFIKEILFPIDWGFLHSLLHSIDIALLKYYVNKEDSNNINQENMRDMLIDSLSFAILTKFVYFTNMGYNTRVKRYLTKLIYYSTPVNFNSRVESYKSYKIDSTSFENYVELYLNEKNYTECYTHVLNTINDDLDFVIKHWFKNNNTVFKAWCINNTNTFKNYILETSLPPKDKLVRYSYLFSKTKKEEKLGIETMEIERDNMKIFIARASGEITKYVSATKFVFTLMETTDDYSEIHYKERVFEALKRLYSHYFKNVKSEENIRHISYSDNVYESNKEFDSINTEFEIYAPTQERKIKIYRIKNDTAIKQSKVSEVFDGWITALEIVTNEYEIARKEF